MKSKNVTLYSVSATHMDGSEGLLFIRPAPFNFDEWANTTERKNACKLLGCKLKCEEIIVEIP